MRELLSNVVVKVLWSRLISIVDEAATGLVRTSYSMVVRDFHDYCVGIFDAKGNMLAHSTKTTPGFIGMMPFVMHHFLSVFPLNHLEDGDVLITNDPWLATGHNNDITIATPIFFDGVIIGFAVCVVHHLDIGGRMASLESRDMYEEGLKIPIMKLYERGIVNQTVQNFIRANVRMSEKVIGDLGAQLAANNLCVRGVIKMVREYEFADLVMLADVTTRLASESMRRKIRQIPNGRFTNAVRVPPPGRMTTPIEIVVSVEIADDTITIDYEGSQAEVPAAVNVTLPFTASYSTFPIKAALDPEVPNNAGGLEPITVKAPVGSVLNCSPPAPTYGRTYVAHLLPEIVLGALAPAIPDRVIAACGSTPLVALTFAGRKYSGERFLSLISHMGGYGASAKRDGHSSLAFPGNTATIPVEVVENDTCLLYEKKALVIDSGGPGEHRGGLGQEVVVSVPDRAANQKKEPVVASLRGSNRSCNSVFPVFGREGGQAGRSTLLAVNGKDATHGVPYQLFAGDRLHLKLPGGGGYGHAWKRDPALVREDVMAGLVSLEGARADYGVALVGPDLVIDNVATATLRNQMSNGESETRRGDESIEGRNLKPVNWR